MAKSTDYKPYIRDVNAFSTMQEKAGKDEASDLDKIMSITVAVKSCTVTFINGSSQSEVLVEPGKSINGDIDDSQSMPSDPTRPGYTFKGWFTQPDGKGDKFTGDTVVNSDMTVYAYFKKDPSNPYNPGKPDPGRVDGDDRVETGVKISQKYYDKAKTVIVVRHDLFPDSMTSSVLAKLKDAPILLNPTNKLDPRVDSEIKRLGAEEVIIVGGPDSISEKVRGDLKAYDKDKDVERIAGVDRYGTSEMVARRVTGITGKKNVGVVASGQVFPDALSAGTFASRDGYPILLVKKDSLPEQIVRAISDLNIKKAYIVGGTSTISKYTEANLPGVLERMAGKDRYETSVAIAKSKFKDSTEAFIASGEEFADALVISPVSGKYNRPTLLASRNKKTNAVVKKYIEESYLTSITAIGGEKYLPKSVILDLVGK
ncbi:cell wall-binding repeat-containing protein [Peptostreptococcus stomatis]